MYYIAKSQPEVSIWQKVKRLGDFKPDEGAEYVVSTSMPDNPAPRRLFTHRVYIGLNGKLKKTEEFTQVNRKP